MKLITLFAAAAAVGTATVGGVGYFAVTFDYSEGGRAGTVTKFSNKGIFNKTWEGELAMNNFSRGQNGSLSNSFLFSAKDPAVIKALEEARDHGAPVKLQYKQTLAHLPWQQDTSYVIVGVEPTQMAPAQQPPVLPLQR